MAPTRSYRFWTTEEVLEPDKAKSIPTWRGKYGVDPIISPHIIEQQKGQFLQLLTEFEEVTGDSLGHTLAC